jgi:hypothetical protein
MTKYLVSYQMVHDFQVVVEADSEDSAYEMLLTDDVDQFEPEFVMADLNYDTVDIMEVES